MFFTYSSMQPYISRLHQFSEQSKPNLSLSTSFRSMHSSLLNFSDFKKLENVPIQMFKIKKVVSIDYKGTI